MLFVQRMHNTTQSLSSLVKAHILQHMAAECGVKLWILNPVLFHYGFGVQ